MDGWPLDYLTPEARVELALVPVVIALLLRLLLGRTQLTRWSLLLGTMWFAMHVLMAPYSAGIRENLMEVGQTFR